MAANADAGSYTLYGMEHSYFTGKVRPYLRYKQIPYREKLSTLWIYQRFIIPRTGVRFIPVLQTPEDGVIQDSTAIIEYLEQRFPERPVLPATPRQRLAALLFELYADEWFLLPAMHYRWHYADRQEDWLMAEFGRVGGKLLPAAVRRLIGRQVSKPFRGSLQVLGITSKTGPAIEAWFEQFLERFETHLSAHPYLLGTRPSLGDFALAGPLYAHMWRDPYSSKLMDAKAPNTVDWIRRINAPSQPAGEFLASDEVPATLTPILRHLFAEQWPILEDTSRRLDRWQATHPGRAHVSRAIGEHDYRIGGVREKRLVFPYAQWMMQRPLDYYRRLPKSQRAEVDAWLKQVGGFDAMQFELGTRLDRRDNRLVIATAEPA